jgi:hypothetical protein
MRVSIWKVGLALLFISASLWAAQDPLMGTWKLNLSKSMYNPGPPPKSSLNTYGPYGQDGFTYDAVQVDAQGKSLHVTFVAEYNGKDYPVTGDRTRDAIFAERIDAYTTRTTNKKNGKITTTSLRVVSKDGRTITLTTAGTNAQGQPMNNVAVYDRL